MEYVSTAKWRERRWRLFSTFPEAKGEEVSMVQEEGTEERRYPRKIIMRPRAIMGMQRSCPIVTHWKMNPK